MYIKIFDANFLQQKTFFHKEWYVKIYFYLRNELNILDLSTLFVEISLQTWESDQLQDWGETVDSAYTQDKTNTMDPMWNEGFIFRVKLQYLLIRRAWFLLAITLGTTHEATLNAENTQCGQILRKYCVVF